ncbi:hypothetical protein METBIDRAFT_13684 [Metschnikowia bicuspidata var. bicuspidata NRRL YB-4993]|uniref:Uncharacterized protein n=1 Tax=Metschnikowia bicuspidata var. bicuspidata NRRL YB-4993 TaxID=869754 RepID=A0A1A0H612_9ASCO|nr:hypothetical protein METBIDRAFT_13684 [Metschnikowia bicuspidata var. bicuspidata NRRL YB-4993]OBA19395.1 hypothetical protein METBIDRAFT_13684 [Metschnikowia bicuspidata var. bicuspidata NRRL YB-4993]
MAAPLDIIKAPRKSKALRTKISCSGSSRNSPPHPLESSITEDALSDSEPESLLDSSYNESILSTVTSDTSCACSTTTSCCSWSPTNLRSVSLLPVVLTSCVAAYTPRVVPKSRVSSSKLTELLRKAEPLESRKVGPAAKSALSYQIPKVSSLSPWQAFLALFINYSMRSESQKDSGERFPEGTSHGICLDSRQGKGIGSTKADRELETFVESASEPCEPVMYKSKARNREYRVNSEFLKRYAMDCNARLKGVLPIFPEDVALLSCRPSLRKFDREHGLNRVSEMSRDKLWNSVVLPPRKDSCPRSVIDFENYLHSRDGARTASIVSKYSSRLPWATHHSSIKPAGRLRTSACVKSKTSPTLGHSIPQYTVKGWQNERWVPF